MAEWTRLSDELEHWEGMGRKSRREKGKGREGMMGRKSLNVKGWKREYRRERKGREEEMGWEGKGKREEGERNRRETKGKRREEKGKGCSAA